MASSSFRVEKEDAYASLEELDSESSMEFVNKANQLCLKALGDPTKAKTKSYKRILEVLEADDRIPFVSKMGVDESGNEILFNLWRDSKNKRGLWRKTTLASYQSKNTKWTKVLDVDELAKNDDIPWNWMGSRVLPRGRDPMSKDGKRVTRVMISLSRGSPDAVVMREFNLLTSSFVTSNPFSIPEGNTRACYKSRDVLLVGSDFGPSTLTKSGYPRTIREWTRGTDLASAPVVFEGEFTDVAVSAYIDDQRVRGGGIYEVRTRSITFQRTKFWIRKVKYEHLLASNDKKRIEIGEPPEFKQVMVPEDSEIDFVGNLLMITLRSKWSPQSGKTFKGGSIIYVNAHKFVKYGPVDRIYHILFQPSERIQVENYAVTKTYLILSLLENVNSKLEFYRLEKDANKLRLVGTDKNSSVRSIHIRAADPYEGDDFWVTSTSYINPSTLYLADATKFDSDDKKVIKKAEPSVYLVKKLKSLPDRFDSTDLEVVQNMAQSKDGTYIPYYMIMKKGTSMNRRNPTLLYGYGGFQVTLGPHYLGATGVAWVERGGVYVEANIRGGGEFGPSWHQAAVRENRNKSYEDFIAVAEHLISTKVCKSKTLGIRGGANGGLLVANMYVMRPDLFGAVHCAVPILDMKRFPALQGTESSSDWINEFGNPGTSDWKSFMKQYSPYHNIKKETKKYPPILFTANKNDDRMHPGHARKMVKKLWDLGQGKKWPTYYHENVEGGSNGMPATTKQYAYSTALGYDFLFKTLSKNAEKAEKSEK
mmetsp:Transcript_15156/g.42717  ORF Transcript_15156/g.42717 Transcript_15156/m.42717 type:complete len:763 (+) Transcript_15156:331-2619(+)|eukprot:CAMPEP_0119573452 /NCGR_PEP_ID=MMETSP1352-20130426/45130_1 /TAXON_ID=265584 /ORGANISM="Stauroneis constricta, Strain CCMP1120" /LENGTH=762 /DNA_ID=CAMNT_0007623141 /DNA_START=323 /DNA_END=2611 /DNA_ORIENTATION=+